MTSPDWQHLNLRKLSELRQRYLAASEELGADYWDEHLLADYDATFGARIGWKWQSVLEELSSVGFEPAEGMPVLDWGCGSGVAVRQVVEHWPSLRSSPIHLYDRSAHAVHYAANQLRATGARDVRPTTSEKNVDHSGLVLISHVVTELDEQRLDELTTRLSAARAVIWVEPGTSFASRRLIAARERLRTGFQLIGPCPHQGSCGLTSADNERHWCHHFASPPSYVFQDGNWRRFGEAMGIDLRSLPVSFLACEKREAARAASTEKIRVIGRARQYKGYCKYLGCSAAGVSEQRLMKRESAARYKELAKGRFTMVIESES